MLQVCVNGRHDGSWHPGLPVSPDDVAASAAAAVAAGADLVHVHPKRTDGTDSLESEAVSAAVTAVRAAVPDWVGVGVTTGAWAAPDPGDRAGLVGSWRVLPDFASVNWHEDGAEQVARALLDRGVGVEAGLFSGTDAVRRFQDSPLRDRVTRVLLEVTDTDPVSAPGTAAQLRDELLPCPVPVLLHGEEAAAWPVLRVAARSGLATRVGLEDMRKLPDGRSAPDNASLVIAACGVIAAESARH